MLIAIKATALAGSIAVTTIIVCHVCMMVYEKLKQ